MTSEQISAAIKKLIELRDKVYALETGKYGELDLSREQVIILNEKADILKQSLKDDAALISVGIPIEKIEPVGPVKE